MSYKFKGIKRGRNIQLVDANGQRIFKQIDDAIAKELKAIALHGVDLAFCRYCVNELRNIDCEKQSERAEAFWIACITRFFKCFGYSKSRSRLLPDEIFGTSESSDSFEFYRALRNKHIVHDENPFSDAHVVVALDAVNLDETSVEARFAYTFYIIGGEEIERLQQLVETTLCWVTSKRVELESTLSSNYSQWTRKKLDSLPNLEVSAPSLTDVFETREPWVKG